MQPVPLGHRRWFTFLIGFIAVVIATICLQVVQRVVPDTVEDAHFALTLLFMGAVRGYFALLKIYLPLLLIKLTHGSKEPYPPDES